MDGVEMKDSALGELQESLGDLHTASQLRGKRYDKVKEDALKDVINVARDWISHQQSGKEADAKPDVAKQLVFRELYSSIQRIREDGATEARERAVIKAGEEAVACLNGQYNGRNG